MRSYIECKAGEKRERQQIILHVSVLLLRFKTMLQNFPDLGLWVSVGPFFPCQSLP